MAQPAPHEGGGMLPPTVPLRGSTVAATGSSGAMPTTRSDSTADFVDYDDTTDCSSQYTGSVCTTPRSKSSFRRAKGRPKGKSKGKSKGKQLRAKRSARSTTSSRSSSRRGSSSTQKSKPALPRVTCKAWAVVDFHSCKLLYGSRENLALQIASITKVMTAVLVLKAADVEPGLLEEYILVSADSAGVGGTSATLRTGEVYTVKDLLYGMMLPSGNDAASALAEYLGDSFAPPPAHTWASTPPLHPEGMLHPWSRFVAEMNREAGRAGLKSTSFGNPHGLQHFKLKSTAHDVCRLVKHAMQWDLFRNIVACESYSCEAKVLHSMVDRESNSRVYPYVAEWHNTNRLLGKVVRPYSSGALSTTRFVFQGVKTGITRAAGGCLASLVQRQRANTSTSGGGGGGGGGGGAGGGAGAGDGDAAGDGDSGSATASGASSTTSSTKKRKGGGTRLDRLQGMLVVVLGAQGARQRFSDTERITTWALRQLAS